MKQPNHQSSKQATKLPKKKIIKLKMASNFPKLAIEIPTHVPIPTAKRHRVAKPHGQSGHNFEGKWRQLGSIENRIEFFKKLGLGETGKGKLAGRSMAEYEIKMTEKGFTFKVKSFIKTSEDPMGESYEWGKNKSDRDLMTGENGVQRWNMEGDRMIGEFTYNDSGLRVKIVRECESSDGPMVETWSVDGVEGRRNFTRF